jgi:hypothetical protein
MSPQSLLLIVLVPVLILILFGALQNRPQSKRSSSVQGDIASPTHPMQPDPQSDIPDIAPEDWDVLLSAITDRLRSAVDQRRAAATEPQVRDAEGRLQVIVLECVDALDQLHAALANARGRQRQVEPGMRAPQVTRRSGPLPLA